MRMTIFMYLIFATSLMLAACNTMEGAGQDIQAGGKNLERSADDNKTR